MQRNSTESGGSARAGCRFDSVDRETPGTDDGHVASGSDDDRAGDYLYHSTAAHFDDDDDRATNHINGSEPWPISSCHFLR